VEKQVRKKLLKKVRKKVMKKVWKTPGIPVVPGFTAIPGTSGILDNVLAISAVNSAIFVTVCFFGYFAL